MKTEEGQIGIKARTVLWYLTFVGFAMNYMIRININIAIVDMISEEFRGNTKVVQSECFSVANSTNETFYEILEEEKIENTRKFISFERRFLDFMKVNWLYVKGLII